MPQRLSALLKIRVCWGLSPAGYRQFWAWNTAVVGWWQPLAVPTLRQGWDRTASGAVEFENFEWPKAGSGR